MISKKNLQSSILLKNTFSLYCMTAAKYILPFVVTACLTRRLGSEQYGVITYITAVMNYYLMFFDFGFNYSATKKISEKRDCPTYIKQIVSEVFTAKIILVGLGSILLIILCFCIRILKNNILLLVLYYLATASNVLVPDFLYRGLEKMQYITSRYIISKLIGTVLIFLMVMGPEHILLIPVFNLFGNIVSVIFTVSHMKKELGYCYCFAPLLSTIQSIKTSLIYFASTAASSVLSAFNTFAMGFASFSEAEIAYWGVAFQVVGAIQALYDPITSSVYPHVVVRKNYKFVLKLTCILSCAVVLGCILLYFFSDVVITILAGSDYLAAVNVLRMLIPVVFFSFPAQMLGFPLLGAMGQQKWVTLSTVSTGAIHIFATFLLLWLGQYTLVSMSILRGISEGLLLGIRIIFVLMFLYKNKVNIK